jgi:hypothetical protein
MGTLYSSSYPSPPRNVCRCLVSNSETVNLKDGAGGTNVESEGACVHSSRDSCVILLLQQFPAGVIDHSMYWQTQLI